MITEINILSVFLMNLLSLWLVIAPLVGKIRFKFEYLLKHKANPSVWLCYLIALRFSSCRCSCSHIVHALLTGTQRSSVFSQCD